MNQTRSAESAIVVGAGIVGIACAHYLNRRGMRVTVIDRASVAGACSYGNCGYICPSHVPPLTEPGAIAVALKSLFQPQSPFRVKPSLSPSLWNWMWQFGKRCNSAQVLWAGKHLQAILDASLLEYRHLIAEHQFDCEWQDDGLLYVFATKHGMEEFAETDRMLTEHFGVAAKRIEGADLTAFDPGLRSGLVGAFHYPGDCSVRPDLLNQAWCRLLRENGVEVVEDCELREIGRGVDRVTRLMTSRGEFTADRFVFAMGAWSTHWSQQLDCHIPIQPGKGYSVTLTRPDACPRYPMLFPEKKVGVSPFQHGMRLGSMMEFVGYDASIPERRIQQLRDAARPYLVASVDGKACETWFGWRPMTWDSLPIIGPVPGLHNGFLATGHNMLGMSLAPATGRLIAEIICGEKPHLDTTPYSPARF
jgi:D-amino-acid dehydrogenase